ncbi:MAG TPA: enoyl-CoA hydratase-related protein [Candidatus Polarisedimenticolaceae bacterium]|nr:enoyl-CoA hydratase-related protein [Candidatus Polarisedimenticolaceae bacterium]
MTAARWVRVESKTDGLRVLTLDKPPVNALGRELVEDLGRALADLGDDHDARCLIVRSGGAHFCAGADLKERQGMSLDEVRAFVPKLAGVCRAVAELPFPSVAAVRGTAAGGGCELALACDLRILAEDARIGLRETALAILPGAGGTQRLSRIAGVAKAKRWIFTAKLYDAAQAKSDGVADDVVPAAALDDAALTAAETIAANGPVAVRLAKRAIEGGFDLTLAEGLALEWQCYEGVLGTKDREEALRAFAEKRAPKYEGR